VAREKSEAGRAWGNDHVPVACRNPEAFDAVEPRSMEYEAAHRLLVHSRRLRPDRYRSIEVFARKGRHEPVRVDPVHLWP
jgi:hypothetical protein